MRVTRSNFLVDRPGLNLRSCMKMCAMFVLAGLRSGFTFPLGLET